MRIIKRRKSLHLLNEEKKSKNVTYEKLHSLCLEQVRLGTFGWLLGQLVKFG